MAYTAGAFSAGQVPTTAIWNELWANDAAFNNGSGFVNNAFGAPLLATNAILLSYVPLTGNYNTGGTVSNTQVTGLTTTVTIPAGGRSVEIVAYAGFITTTAGNITILQIWDGVVGSGTLLATSHEKSADSTFDCNIYVSAIVTPAAGSKTYNVGITTSVQTQLNFTNSNNPGAYIMVRVL